MNFVLFLRDDHNDTDFQNGMCFETKKKQTREISRVCHLVIIYDAEIFIWAWERWSDKGVEQIT